MKAASEIHAPVGGTVTEVNETLTDAPTKANEDPLGEGWFFKLKVSNPGELDELMGRDGLQSHSGLERPEQRLEDEMTRFGVRERFGTIATTSSADTSVRVHGTSSRCWRCSGFGPWTNWSEKSCTAKFVHRPPWHSTMGHPARSVAPAARHRRKKQDLQVVHRHRLFRLPYAPGHSAKRSREPRLVHVLCSLPGRDLTRPSRSCSQLSNNGRRFDGHGGRRTPPCWTRARRRRKR